MKCISCSADINPQWVHAIDMNVCPFCGQHIMEEHLKNLLVTLRETMDSLSTYQEQLDDWMLSNHSYIKTNSPDLIKHIPAELTQELKKLEDENDFNKRKEAQKFTVKVKTEHGEEEVVAEKIQSEEKTSEFFQRAEVIKKSDRGISPAEKTQHLKAMAQQIKRAGTQSLSTSGSSMTIPPELLDGADPEAALEYEQIMSGNDISSAIAGDSFDDDLPGGDFILQANQAMARKNGGNAKDLAHLQRLQSKSLEAKRNMVTGAKGSFSRG